MPVIKSLCNGSIGKGVEQLFTKKDSGPIARSAVKKLIQRECKKFSHSDDGRYFQGADIEALQNINIIEMINKLECNTPILWNIISAVATPHLSIKSNIKTLFAASVLLNSRSQKFNLIQHAIGICLYNNQLQKDGFMLLNKLGASVSHHCLHDKLKQASKDGERLVETWKSSAEKNQTEKKSLYVKEEHCYCSETPPNDHLYNRTETKEPEEVKPALGYRFNIDNLDFYIKVRDMTSDNQNKMKHYVQVMALGDRVSCEHLSDKNPVGRLSEVGHENFLPNGDDMNNLKKDMIHVVALVLIENMKEFKVFEGCYPQFFEHEYSEKMKEKTDVVRF